jgi:hypothetical protein
MDTLPMILSHFFQAWTGPYQAGFSIGNLFSLPPASAGFLVGFLFNPDDVSNLFL